MTTKPMSTALQRPSWEHALLALAHEARVAATAPAVHHFTGVQHLDRAYDYCAALTAKQSRSFHMASGLLPPEKRRAVRALYAFCRVTDDLVDCPGSGAARRLAAWRARALSPEPPAGDLVALAWADTRQRYHIPARYAEQLCDGVARDLVQTRYETFDDLAAYAYGVASTVGLMSMHIIGFTGRDALPYAIKLGVALQLTNILRDVGADWRAGRVYLPSEELDLFGIGDAELSAGRVDGRWRAFMRYQIERNRYLYAEAWPGIALLHADGRRAITAAATLYRAILSDIEAHDYDVFRRRAHVSAARKILSLPAIWWSAR
jgi:phytoene synthase